MTPNSLMNDLLYFKNLITNSLKKTNYAFLSLSRELNTYLYGKIPFFRILRVFRLNSTCRKFHYIEYYFMMYQNKIGIFNNLNNNNEKIFIMTFFATRFYYIDVY